jgi:hypothetical protein
MLLNNLLEPINQDVGTEIAVVVGDSAAVALSDAEFTDQLEVLARDIIHIDRSATFRIAARVAKAHELFVNRRDEGGFQGWVEDRLGYSRSHAYRLLDVDRLAKMSQGWDIFGTLPTTALYLLAARSTPDEIRNEIAGRIKTGEKVSCAAVAEAIAHQNGVDPAESGEMAVKGGESNASSESATSSTVLPTGEDAGLNKLTAAGLDASDLKVMAPRG